MKSAYLKDDALLAEVCQRREADPDALHIWWLGQSGFLCCAGDRVVFFDPYLSDSLSRKYADTDKPHVRVTEMVIEPGRLDFVDAITSSHNHTDHLDAETIQALVQANRGLKLVAPEANRQLVEERSGMPSGDVVGLTGDDEAEVNGIRFRSLPAAHNELSTDDSGRHQFLGFVAEWAGCRIYHSGDTLMYPDLIERLQAMGPIDVALLPINGNKPERRVAGNLDPQEAAELAKAIGACQVVPCHYDMFEFNTADPTDFAAACEAIGQPHTILRNGEGLSLPRA